MRTPGQCYPRTIWSTSSCRCSTSSAMATRTPPEARPNSCGPRSHPAPTSRRRKPSPRTSEELRYPSAKAPRPRSRPRCFGSRRSFARASPPWRSCTTDPSATTARARPPGRTPSDSRRGRRTSRTRRPGRAPSWRPSSRRRASSPRGLGSPAKLPDPDSPRSSSVLSSSPTRAGAPISSRTRR